LQLAILFYTKPEKGVVFSKTSSAEIVNVPLSEWTIWLAPRRLTCC